MAILKAKIKHWRSIGDDPGVELDLGRITVLSEENDSGKKRTEMFLYEQGYIKQREKRVLLHFKWLVHYQIQGWSLTKIADHYNKDSKKIHNEDTIYHGVISAAELVLLNLRRKR